MNMTMCMNILHHVCISALYCLWLHVYVYMHWCWTMQSGTEYYCWYFVALWFWWILYPIILTNLMTIDMVCVSLHRFHLLYHIFRLFNRMRNNHPTANLTQRQMTWRTPSKKDIVLRKLDEIRIQKDYPNCQRILFVRWSSVRTDSEGWVRIGARGMAPRPAWILVDVGEGSA